MKFMKKLLIYVLIFSGWIIFVLINRKHTSYINNRTYQSEYEDSYEGEIISKYFRKVIHLKVRGKDGIYDLSAFLSPELRDSAAVGDSLIKFKNSNECLLIKKTGRRKYEYMYKPD